MENLDEMLSRLSLSRTFLVEDDHLVLTGRQLGILSEHFRQLLWQCSHGRQRRIAVMVRNSARHLALLLAVGRTEMLLFPIPAGASPRQISTLTEAFSFDLVVTDPATAHLLLAGEASFAHGFSDGEMVCLVRDVKSESSAALPADSQIAILTSGSTGAPRGVVHSWRNVLLNASLHAQAISLASTDRIAGALPLHFSYGLVASALATLTTEATLVLGRPEATALMTWLRAKKISVLGTTPSIVRRMIGPGDSAALRTLTIGGDVTSSALSRDLCSYFPHTELFATYGLTEAGPRVATCRLGEMSTSDQSVVPLGKPLEGVTLSLATVDDATEPAELLVDTPTKMLGYLEKGTGGLDKSASTVPIRTGDLFIRKGEQYSFWGRKKRVLVRGGEKISPMVIESHLRDFPGVSAAWVDGLAHPEHGEVPRAFVVSTGGTNVEVMRHLRASLPASHIPAEIHFVDTLPSYARPK